jgi:hypothetical protein
MAFLNRPPVNWEVEQNFVLTVWQKRQFSPGIKKFWMHDAVITRERGDPLFKIFSRNNGRYYLCTADDLTILEYVVFEVWKHISLLQHLLLFKHKLLECKLGSINIIIDWTRELFQRERLCRLLLIKWRAIDLHLHGSDIVHVEFETLFIGVRLGFIIYIALGDSGLRSENILNAVHLGRIHSAEDPWLHQTVPYPLLLYPIYFTSSPVLLY